MGYRLLAAALVVLALSACGGNTVKQPQTTPAEAHWRAGLTHWGASMTAAINGVSLLFSNPASVRAIEAGDRKIGAKINRFAQTLTGCATTVLRLGAVPARFAASGQQALRACAALQQASALVRSGVRQVQHGLGFDLLSRSGDAFTAGQDAVRRALFDVRLSTP
jgi:hypothetical protein